MEMYTWSDILVASFQAVWANVITFVPTIIFAVLIFLVGWLLSVIVGRLVVQVIGALKIDHALQSAGVGDIIKRLGFTLNSGMFFASLIRWFIILVFLVASLETVGFTQITLFLQDVVLNYVPKVIVAVLMLVIGAIVADMVKRLIVRSASAAHISTAGFLALTAQWSIWIVTIFAALNQLQIASEFLQSLFTGIVVALSLAFGISFGLGGQKAAAELIEKMKRDIEV